MRLGDRGAIDDDRAVNPDELGRIELSLEHAHALAVEERLLPA
ncbi:MAG TPA: hypothetical protein VFD36_27990 [Kofleriaceae bacterium]|nr:hypothetical protein [Kofleriaceae bacterium]